MRAILHCIIGFGAAMERAMHRKLWIVVIAGVALGIGSQFVPSTAWAG